MISRQALRWMIPAAVLVSSLTAHAATPQAPLPPSQIDTATYKAVLDAVQRTSDTAVNVTKDTAKTAIDAVQSSNATLQTVFTTGAAILSAVLALVGFVGWKSISDMKAEFKKRVDDTITEIGKKGDELIKQGADDFFQLNRRLTYAHHNGLKLISTRDEVVGRLLKEEYEEILKLGDRLNDRRATSYAHAQLGFLAFNLGDFRKSADHYRLALQHNDAWPDRYYNLACALEVCYVRGGKKEPALRREAEDKLTTYLSVYAVGSIGAISDQDFRELFNENVALRSDYFRAATQEMLDRSSKEPGSATTYLTDTKLAWFFQHNKELAERLRQAEATAENRQWFGG